jgi:D-3-phosphoglycerate dehydrogenase
MLRNIDGMRDRFARHGVDIDTPDVVQTLSEAELIELVPQFDGWIIGDDPATGRVFEAGKAGRLKAAVKWGVGTDNVDLAAAAAVGISVPNTPGMFGAEVADVAMGYVIGLARRLFEIDRGVRAHRWPKPTGTSLADRTVALVGLGDVGCCAAQRLLAADMKIIGYDPAPRGDVPSAVERSVWPDRIESADFIVLTCALTASNRHLLNAEIFARAQRGVRIVNVARGPLIDESALISALRDGTVSGAALDVLEEEPLPFASPLRDFENCIFGSHNASHTAEAVHRTSGRAITLLFERLGIEDRS